jgi:hypothetical protein
MRCCCDRGEQLRIDVLVGAQEVDGLSRRRVNRVLALDEEETELVAPAPVLQPAKRAGDALRRPARLPQPAALSAR